MEVESSALHPPYSLRVEWFFVSERGGKGGGGEERGGEGEEG